MLYVRGESVQIGGLLSRTRGGESGALVLVGQSGIGKTTLLAFAREKARGFRVLSGTGVRAEQSVSFGGLDQLLGPVRASFDGIPEPQATALRTALDLTSSKRLDRDAVLRGTHSLLVALAGEGPVLCTVDDAHLLDPVSLAALSFAARRVERERIAFLFARREEPAIAELEGLDELELAGLDFDQATALLESEQPGRVAPEVVSRLVEATGGNPLALLDLLGLLSDAQLAGRVPLEYPLPVPDRFAEAFAGRAETLSPEARRTLVTVAAADTQSIRVLTEDGAVAGLTREALEECENAEIVLIRNGLVAFRHPLARAAAYETAPPSAQRDAHRRLAAATTGDRRALHLAAAAPGPDEETAAELQRAGERALLRSGYLTASGWFARAADLTPEPADRAARLALAAQVALVAGKPAEARALAVAGLETTADPSTRTSVGRVIDLLDEAARPSDDAVGPVWDELPLRGSEPDARDDPEILLTHADELLQAGRAPPELRPPVEAALATAREQEALWFVPSALVHRARLGIVTGSWGPAEADALEARALAVQLGQARPRIDACMLLAELDARRGLTRECLSRLDEAVGLQDVPRTRARRSATLGLLDLGLGRLEEAVEELEAASVLGDDAPGTTLTFAVDLAEAYVRAGRVDEAKPVAARKARASGPLAHVGAAWCRALVGSERTSGQWFEKALAGLGDPDVHPFERARIELSYGERLRRAGSRAAAREHLREAHAVFERLGAVPWTERAGAELLATGETARRRTPETLDELTSQERRVLDVIAAGASVKQAAQSLFLSPKTVEFHLGKVYRKLGVHSRRELALALERMRAEGVDVAGRG